MSTLQDWSVVSRERPDRSLDTFWYRFEALLAVQGGAGAASGRIFKHLRLLEHSRRVTGGPLGNIFVSREVVTPSRETF